MTETVTKLILLRHGEVEGSKRLVGHTDAPLSEAGREGVRLAAGKLSGTHFDALYSSDLSRSVESASIVGAPLKLSPCRITELRELYMGEWDGITAEEVIKRWPEEISRWWNDPVSYRTPGGEGLSDLHARVIPALESILDAHRGQTICLVAHGGVNRVILFHAMGLALARYYTVSQDYACINRLRYFGDGKIVVDLING